MFARAGNLLGNGRDAPERDDEPIVGAFTGRRRYDAALEIHVLHVGVQNVERAAALIGAERYHDVCRARAPVGNRPQKRREKLRVAAVDEQHGCVRIAAQLALEAEGGGDAAEPTA